MKFKYRFKQGGNLYTPQEIFTQENGPEQLKLILLARQNAILAMRVRHGDRLPAEQPGEKFNVKLSLYFAAELAVLGIELSQE